MGSHANRDERNLTDEREVAKAKAWAEAGRALKQYVSGCLFLAILAALGVAYLAGAVSQAIKPDCISPTHQTP
jgi:hypothetical protein